MDQQDVIRAIKEHIIHRFGLPQTVVADRGTVFFGDQVQASANDYGFEFTHSNPYYARGNVQAESTNKILKGIIERMVEDKSRMWHDALYEALWSYRTYKRTAIVVTPFMLAYGHDVILPIEVTVRAVKRAGSGQLGLKFVWVFQALGWVKLVRKKVGPGSGQTQIC